VGDPTPVISSVVPDPWVSGTATNFTITGSGFGTNPSHSISGPGVTGFAKSSASGTTITGAVTIPSGASGTAVATVTSTGFGGNAFVSAPQQGGTMSQAQTQRNVQIALCGDQRDTIKQEYVTYGVMLNPQCSWFTQTAHSQYFAFAELNVNGVYSWALIKQPLTVNQTQLYGLDRWRQLIGSAQTTNSVYRSPAHNASAGGAPQSRHMYGDAVDLRNVTQSQQEYDAKALSADRNSPLPNARADYVEPTNLACGLQCVHADWRYTDKDVYSQ
jgi:hypothetical protein